ncbi:MAG TPA: glycoside hydrolase family 65 protein, partial [Pseudonocardiaceae bacterium]
MTSAWEFGYDAYHPAEEGRREALCTLGNGYFATRGAARESRADDVHNPGSYAAGCYNRLRDEVAGHSVENESLVNLPNWLVLTFAVDDGDWFDLDRCEVLEYRQTLDLRRGTLTRRLRVRDSAGRCTQLTERRFVHMELPHFAGLQTTITAENWSGRLRVRSGIDGAVENTGVERYRKLSGRHLTTVAAEPRDDDMVMLVAETNQSHIRIAVAARTRVVDDGHQHTPASEMIREADRVSRDLTVELTAGQHLTVEKVVALYTGRDRAVSEPGEAAVAELRQAASFDALLERHVLAWAQLWRRFHIDLSDGAELHEEGVLTIRLHLFHLLQTVSPHTA